MANLNPHIDAIFNGHTHQKYLFERPSPGATGRPAPIVQTGQYGENVGQIQLTFDTRHRQGDRLQGTQPPTCHDQRRRPDHRVPATAAVKTTVDAALANANGPG